ncbi:hypothetical protein NRK68_17370 [Streptomyces yangpuensis]|uniref:Uncharacterized protein n=1 Tax=Streptomyces yangpuensis TaxID=1648182 RepID=A0ABY5PXB3_9ACTN|nr:hypothetical protein [Streptomyces yangpuensis]UUY48801.1 hypothetical protein NRK68_17370 [Streptomyces yangpuensis]
MIQGFRPSRWLACAALTAAALAPAASAYAGPLTPAHRSGGGAAHAARPGYVPAASSAAGRTTADEADEGDGPREELAGSAAGVGRERPGRPAGEPANPELLIASRPLPVRPRTEPVPPPAPPSAPPPPVSQPSAADPTERDAVSALGTEPNDRAADLAAHILPLGTGFALMGLGLGYLGVRLRRGA